MLFPFFFSFTFSMQLRKKRTVIDGKSVYVLSLANTTKVKKYTMRDLAANESKSATTKTSPLA